MIVPIPLSTSLLALAAGPQMVALPSAAPPPPSPLGYQSVYTDEERMNPWYLSLGASLVTTRSSDGPSEEIDFDEGYGVQVALGRRFIGRADDGFAWDVEAEVVWNDQDADSDGALQAVNDLNTASVFLNGLAAIAIAERAELFAGGGLGLGWVSPNTSSDTLTSFDDEDGPFLAWQLRAGVRFAASRALDVEFGYRFMNIDDAEIDDNIGDADFELQTEQHTLGVSLRFGI